LILRGLFLNVGQINTICTTFAQESARKWLFFFNIFSLFHADLKIYYLLADELQVSF